MRKVPSRGVCESLAGKLTGDEEEDARSKRLVKAVEGGVVDKCHDADDDANETSQQGENHKGPGGIPVGCGVTAQKPET